MAKRVKRRFVLLAMLALAATLLLTFGGVYSALRRSVTNEADELIGMIAQNGGRMPSYDASFFDINEEMHYATRYYVVWMDEDGSFLASNMQHIALGTAAQIRQQISEILQRGRSVGYLGTSRYNVFSPENGAAYMVVVLDRSASLNTLHALFLMMQLTALAVFVLVFLLLLWLSRYAVRPYEKNQERQRQFITDAGHELKTPLAVISSNAEVLEMTAGENKWITNIKTQTARISHMVAGLIELSKMEEEKEIEEPKQSLDLSEVVAQTVESFSAAAQTRGMTIDAAIEPDVRITGYLEDMTRLAGILLDNAVKYTDERGLLRVSLSRKGKKALLCVENSCRSLSAEELSHLFDRFYRTDSSRSRETGGYGIGLSLAQMLVQRQKGRLTAECPEEGIIRFSAEL